jgi:hypothetical protein
MASAGDHQAEASIGLLGSGNDGVGSPSQHLHLEAPAPTDSSRTLSLLPLAVRSLREHSFLMSGPAETTKVFPPPRLLYLPSFLLCVGACLGALLGLDALGAQPGLQVLDGPRVVGLDDVVIPVLLDQRLSAGVG